MESTGGDYTEGNAWQYTWHVQHDVPGLIASVCRSYRNIAVAVINNERIRDFAVVILAVRADIVIAKGRCAAFTFLARPRRGYQPSSWAPEINKRE